MRGLHYRSTSLAVRERLKLNEDQIPSILEFLKKEEGVEECAILTTCNRSEIYVVAQDLEASGLAFENLYRQYPMVDLTSRQLILLHDDVLPHLCRVAAGLDSMILGEGQILGQVKDALNMARSTDTVGPLLERLFQTAIRTAKRIRTETGLDQKDTSVAHAAFQLAMKELPNWLNQKIVVMGGGKMAQILLFLLKSSLTPTQQKNVTILNRSPERLHELQQKFNFNGVGWDELDETLLFSDLVFVATGAPHVVLGKTHFESKPTDHKQTVVIDVAVPRNVDVQVAELPHVKLFNIEHLLMGQDAEDLAEKRQVLYAQAETMIETECKHFQRWKHSLPLLPSITRLQEKLETIRQSELAIHASNQTSNYRVMDNMSRRILKKILHEPTVYLKEKTYSTGTAVQSASFLNCLFNL